MLCNPAYIKIAFFVLTPRRKYMYTHYRILYMVFYYFWKCLNIKFVTVLKKCNYILSTIVTELLGNIIWDDVYTYIVLYTYITYFNII